MKTRKIGPGAARVVVALGVLGMSGGCDDDPAGPRPEEIPLVRAELAQPSGPKGYGFRVSGPEAAAALAYGFSSCYQTDDGSATYELPLTGRIVDEMWNYLDWGGTVTLEVYTQYTFTGDGQLTYSESIDASGPGITASFSHQDQASSPGMESVRMYVTHRENIDRSQMTGVHEGSSIFVTYRATSTVDLGTICRPQDLGQALGKGRGAVLRLEP